MSNQITEQLQSSISIALIVFIIGMFYGKSQALGKKAGRNSKRYFLSVVSFFVALTFLSLYVSSDQFDQSIIPGVISALFFYYALKKPIGDFKTNVSDKVGGLFD